MKIIDRYIAYSVIEATLLALLVLLGMQSFISFIGELHDIGTKNYSLMQAFIYVPMTLPGYLYQFFPIAGLLGVVMGLGRLASRSELIVMRAAGVSIGQVLWAVFKVAILILIVVTFVGEWLAPNWQYQAEKRKVIAMSGEQAFSTQQGTWVRDGENFVHINQVLPYGVLQGITRYEFNQHRLLVVSYADNGTYVNGEWLFNNVIASELKQNHVISKQYPKQIWDLTFNPRLLTMTTLDPAQASLPKLYHYLQYLKQNAQNANQTEYQFWKRVLQPLATLIMIGLGVPFVFGPLRSASMGLRILAGVIVGFAFYMLNEFFGPLTMVFQLPPLLAAAFPSLLFGVGGLVLLWFER